MKTKLITTAMAAAFLGAALVPVGHAAAATEEATGTLKAHVAETLKVEFPAGGTSWGTIDQLTNGDAEFNATQTIRFMSNLIKPEFDVSVTPSALSAPGGNTYAMKVKSDYGSYVDRVFKKRTGAPNAWTTLDLDYKSDPMTPPAGASNSVIAGNYEATVNYRVVSKLGE